MTDGARVEILRFGPRHCHCIWSLVEGVSGKGNVSVNRERETKEQILQVIFDVVLCVVHGYTTLPLKRALAAMNCDGSLSQTCR
jgi:hypothetical protein